MKITPDCSTIMKLAETYSIVPMVFLTYVNPIFIYGKERFMKKCTECGIDGIIVPDMPYEEREELAPACEKYGVDIIPLIAPTSNDRIAMIAKKAKGESIRWCHCENYSKIRGRLRAICGRIREKNERGRRPGGTIKGTASDDRGPAVVLWAAGFLRPFDRFGISVLSGFPDNHPLWQKNFSKLTLLSHIRPTQSLRKSIEQRLLHAPKTVQQG